MLRWVTRNKAALSAAAAAFRATHGLNPHPWILMREVGQRSFCVDAKLSTHEGRGTGLRHVLLND